MKKLNIVVTRHDRKQKIKALCEQCRKYESEFAVTTETVLAWNLCNDCTALVLTEALNLKQKEEVTLQ